KLGEFPAPACLAGQTATTTGQTARVHHPHLDGGYGTEAGAEPPAGSAEQAGEAAERPELLGEYRDRQHLPPRIRIHERMQERTGRARGGVREPASDL